MSEENVDVELLIEEVKIRPIWDISREDYKDRIKKQSAWESICELLIENFSQNTENEKNLIIKKLSLKWKNLKDNYSRSIKKKTKSGQPAGAGRQYIYARQLSFLQASMALATTQSTLEDPENDPYYSQSEQQDEEETSPSETTTFPAGTDAPPVAPGTSAPSEKSGGKRKRDFEASLLEYINSPVVVEPPDEDKSFFDSLIPTIKNFNEDQKLDFRSEVLNLVKRIKRQNQTEIPYMGFPSQTYRPMFPPSWGKQPQTQHYFYPTSASQHSTVNHTSSSMSSNSSITSPDLSADFHSSLEALPQPTQPTDSNNYFKF